MEKLVDERDMDMLFLNAFGTDKEFLKLFTAKTVLPQVEYEVKEVYLSKTDKDGESDITVVIENDGRRYGILIEDKIDAIDMFEQPERYIKRGNRGKANKDYEEFYSFIVCPQKYYDNNEAAKRYHHKVMYEEIRDYLKDKKDEASQIRYQVISRAIEKAKKPHKVEIDENASSFFESYKDYQEEKYSELNLTTKRGSNGYWAQYSTRLGSAYLLHKIEDGKVDLTFNKAADHVDRLDVVAEWLRKHNILNASAVVTGMAGSIRVTVPKLNMQIPFDQNDEYDVEVCFKIISTLIEAANIFAVAGSVADLQYRITKGAPLCLQKLIGNCLENSCPSGRKDIWRNSAGITLKS